MAASYACQLMQRNRDSRQTVLHAGFLWLKAQKQRIYAHMNSQLTRRLAAAERAAMLCIPLQRIVRQALWEENHRL